MEKTLLKLSFAIFVLLFGCSSHGDFTLSNTFEKRRNATVVISDIHMGDERACSGTIHKPYGWLVENRKELANFLNCIASSEWIKELVIAGDLVDEWVAPVNVRVWGDNIEDNENTFLDSVCRANENIVKAFRNIKNAGIEIYYTPGNHDMLLNQEKLNRIFGTDVITCKNQNDAAGLGFYLTQNGLTRIEHGHRLDFFNAPDCISNAGINENSIIPPGFIVSKIASSSDLNKSRMSFGYNVGTKWFDALYRDYDLYLAAWKLILYNKPNSIDEKDWNKKIIHTGDLIQRPGLYSYSDIIPTFWGNFKDSRVLYKDTYKTSEWNLRQEINNVPIKLSIREALFTGVFPSYFDDTAIAEYLLPQTSRQKILIMGHTHFPVLKIVQNSEYRKIYANAGSWIDKKWLDKKTPDKTFIVITPDETDKTCRVDLYQFNGTIENSVLINTAVSKDFQL